MPTKEWLEALFEQIRCDVRNHVPPGRDQSLCLTKIDEAEMWATRGL